MLLDNTIHIWIADAADFTDPASAAYFGSLLSEEEKQRFDRFTFDRHRDVFLTSRGLLRTCLSLYSPNRAPAAWHFENNPWGRPALKPAAGFPDFNISHSKGKIALAFGNTPDLGIDLETTEREAKLGIAEHYFAREEVEALKQIRPDRQRERFFELWTLKEAYIKARGKGLSIPLDSFRFAFTENSRLVFHGDESLGVSWHFQLYDLAPYKMALAYKAQPPLPEIRIFSCRQVKDLQDPQPLVTLKPLASTA